MRLRLIIIALFFVGVVSIPVSGQKQGKKIVISGRVSDPDKNPLSDVEIFIDNKNSDRITNSKGFYKVKVSPSSKKLTAFSKMNGMKEVAIEGKIIIDFELYTAVPESITKGKTVKDETVNVGYGTMKKSDMSTTVGKIDGQNKRFSSYTNIYDMIRGEVPGVQVNGKSIMIQGPSSINLSSEPLFVVDGMVVTSIDEIRPQQVKSIEILKGASASIYGSRGANGVILINLIVAEKNK
jgi:TonB-dependent SusC/RagA subfamily outer membrane receptor